MGNGKHCVFISKSKEFLYFDEKKVTSNCRKLNKKFIPLADLFGVAKDMMICPQEEV